MEFNSYIGLDVHKETIAVAIADSGRDGKVRFYGEIANTPERRRQFIKEARRPARQAAALCL